MACQSQAIQQLLQAKRASEKVSEARKRKNRSLKQAKEAQAEIEQYRLQREKEFKAKEAAALGSHGSCSSEVEETQEKMAILQTYFQQSREVLDNLLAFVTFGQKSMKSTASMDRRKKHLLCGLAL
ncbi:V-type proton ATPase subunit G 1 [Heterocephalus glaber]|uniref:V-type proton ATPase subunit G n=1 Tax=Heterocephalus glaber TaxID=10181 RepID=G5B3R2_HETGA|nr:V-type proton ATPase subunit G 1 [Heterocephalus glaber]